MAFTYEEAKNIIYDKHLHKGERNSEAVIFDDLTAETSFGWAFYYNNATYFRTRQQHDAWAGPGPILFNRETGEIRAFGSGQPCREHIEDYEFELEANQSAAEWVIELDNLDLKAKALKLKRAFELDGVEALSLAKRWSPYFLFGKKRDLESVREALLERGLNARIVLLDKELVKQRCVAWRNEHSLHDGYVRALRTVRPSHAHHHAEFDGKEVFIEGMLIMKDGLPVVMTPGVADRWIGFGQDKAIARMREICESEIKNPDQYEILFKGTLSIRGNGIEVFGVKSYQLTHMSGYGLRALL